FCSTVVVAKFMFYLKSCAWGVTTLVIITASTRPRPKTLLIPDFSNSLLAQRLIACRPLTV
ncbi:MAG: hypothetical protein AAB874_03120, partial [Patescibacteria group bacterium]